MSLASGSHNVNRSPKLPVRIFKVSGEALSGFSHVCIQMVSTKPCSLKAVSLQMAPTVGTVNRTYIPRMGAGHEEPPIAQGRVIGQSAIHPPGRFLATFYLFWDRLLESYTPPSSEGCPEQSAKVFISTEMAHLVAIWLHSRQIPKQQDRHRQEKHR